MACFSGCKNEANQIMNDVSVTKCSLVLQNDRENVVSIHLTFKFTALAILYILIDSVLDSRGIRMHCLREGSELKLNIEEDAKSPTNRVHHLFDVVNESLLDKV